jgi:DNA-binding transcriptional ArsR family regulator
MTQSTADKVVAQLRNVKARGDGEYRSSSPLRASSDGEAFHLTIKDGEHGTWFDHVAQEGGSLYTLAKRMGIELPKLAPTTDTAKAKTFAEFCADHGASEETFRKAGWTPSSRGGNPAIAFTTDTGTRYRMLSGNTKYIHGKGYTSSWYKLDNALKIAESGGFPLTLCNGEASTVVAQALGMPVTCITGGSEREIPEKLLESLLEAYRGAIVVAMDCDNKGANAARKLYKQLTSVGYAVTVVDMKLDAKGDIADYLRLWSPAEFYALPHSLGTVEYVDALPRTVTAAELQKKDVPPLEYIIDDLMSTGCYLLAGAPKSRKSFLALHLALNVAQGTKVFERFDVLQSTGVLYLDLEMSENSVHRRVANMMHGKTWPTNLYFGFGDDWPWRGSEAGDHLELWLDAHMDVRVVIIDVLAQWKEAVDPRTPVYTADYDALKKIQRLATRRNICIIVVHHTNKTKMIKGDNPFDKISGSTGIQGAVDAMWLLTKDPDNQYNTVLQMVDRNIHDVDRVDLMWDDFLGAHAVDQKLRLLQSTGAERRQIYDVLAATSIAMTPSEIALEISKTPEAVKKLLSRLVQDKLVEKMGYGKYKPYTNMSHSGYSSTSNHSGHSGYSIESDKNNQEVLKSDQEGARVTKSDSRVTEGFEAVESIKQVKSDQSDIVYKEQILTILRKQATRPDNVCPQIGPRSIWAAIKADMNELLSRNVITWHDDEERLMIPPSA